MSKPIGKVILEKWQEILSLHRWVAYVLPMFVFLLIGSFEPTSNAENGNLLGGIEGESSLSSSGSWIEIPYRFYPWIYTFKILMTAFALRIVWPAFKPLRRSIGWKGIAFGLVGGVAWISLCHLDWDYWKIGSILKTIKLDSVLGSGVRASFNPFEEWKGATWFIIPFLLVRSIGLIVLVPIIEEHFLRGFVIRYFSTERWWKHPIGTATLFAAVVGTLLPMLMHPGELLAAAVWFSWISLLAWHTKNLWECIAAHSVTNLMLGVYVLATNDWRFV